MHGGSFPHRRSGFQPRSPIENLYRLVIRFPFVRESPNLAGYAILTRKNSGSATSTSVDLDENAHALCRRRDWLRRAIAGQISEALVVFESPFEFGPIAFLVCTFCSQTPT